MNSTSLTEILKIKTEKADTTNSLYFFVLKVLVLTKLNSQSDFDKLEAVVNALALRKELDTKFDKNRASLQVASDFILFD